MSICVVAGSNCGHGGWHVGLLTLTLVAGWLGLSSQAGAQEPEAPPAKPPFTEGIYCGACHSNAERAQAMRDAQGREIAPYDLWRASAMANAARDPYWRAVVSVEAAATPRRKHDIEKLCSRCHAPMAESVPLSPDGVVLDYLNQADPQAFLAADGVSCTVCHQITDQALGKPESYTGRYEISPRRVAWGPHANPVADSMQNHAGYLAAEGPHIMQSALCGTCHTLITETLDPDGTPTGHELHEQSAYLEWRNSIYNNEVDVDNPTARTCQDCHVPTTDQDGAVIRTRLARTLAGTDLAEAVPRAPYGRHSFVGGNVLLAKLLRDNAQELQVFASPQALEATIAATRQMLAHQTAKLTLGKVRHQDGRWQIPVQIENLAGHKFPTGFPSRRAWVRLRVRDAQGAVLFQSGGFDATGRLVDAQGQVLPSEVAGQPGQRHYDRIGSAQQVQIYESVMADKQGEMTFTLLRGARFWKDNRLLPKGWQSAHPDGAATAPAGIGSDQDFRAGGDVIWYEVPAPATARLTIEAALYYQSIGTRHVQEVFTVDTPEVRAFRAMYEAVDREPELVGEVRLEVARASDAQPQLARWARKITGTIQWQPPVEGVTIYAALRC